MVDPVEWRRGQRGSLGTSATFSLISGGTMVQRVAAIFGVGFLLVGILGFVTGGTTMDASMETAPRLLGLFPVNLLHNVVHCLFGIWGLAASRSPDGAITFARVGGAIYVVLAVLGLIAPTTFGLIPIGGNDVWLHAVLGLGLLLTALSASKKAAVTT
jgi:uncharacterized protein DUF4383